MTSRANRTYLRSSAQLRPSRRTRPAESFSAVLSGAVGALGLGSAVTVSAGSSGAAMAGVSAAASNDIGEVSRTMAMHVHSSFSEGAGSMEAQLAEAVLAGVDALWWTDHDWRMVAAAYRTAVHFDSLGGEKEAGSAWHWQPVSTGALAASGGGVVSAPTSPNDPSAVAGALQVSCVSAGTAEASFRFYADATSARLNARSNIAGLALQLDVLATSVGPDSWLELLVSLSRRPPAPGRAPVPYQVSYRFGPGPAGRQVQGTLGIVWVPVQTNAWTTVSLTPDADVAALWPDIQAIDNSFSQMWLGATSRNGATCAGFFDYLRFQRTHLGAAAMRDQRQLMNYFAHGYPSVLQIQGLEVSYFHEHLNWYGGTPQIPDSSTWARTKPHSKTNPYVIAQQQADLIHAGGGLASLNHPFGTGTGTGAGASTRHTIVSGLLAAKPNLDVVEVRVRRCRPFEPGTKG